MPRGGSITPMSESSPIDPELLRPVLAPTLGESRTLPAEAYLSDEVFAWEERHFFEDGWVCLGRSDNLERAGDQRAFRIGREGILLVRDQDGGLNGFFNVCRHRGHELLAGRGAEPPRDQVPVPRLGVRPRRHPAGRAPVRRRRRLRPGRVPAGRARVAEWHGWVFVNASAPPRTSPSRRQPRRPDLRVGARAAVRGRPRTST